MTYLLVFLMFFTPWTSRDDYLKMVHRVNHHFSKKMNKEHDFHVYGSGGRLMHDVSEVMLALQTKQALELEQVRQIYVEATQIYMKRINDDKKLRPHLANYPFDMTNLDLSMRFMDKHGQRQPPDCIAYVSNYNNSKGSGIAYYTSPDGKHLDLVHKELYSEALQKVKESGALDNVQYLPVR